MPRYYIDVRSHFATNEDPDGVELPDIVAAKAEALKMGARLLDDWAGLPPTYSSAIVIEIVAATGAATSCSGSVGAAVLH
jgi:hypothetical protein